MTGLRMRLQNTSGFGPADGYTEGLMEYSRLGNTGLVVSRLAFGVMTFGSSKGIFAAVSKVDQPLADRLVAKTLEAGVNFFNTADVYTEGQSEAMLGKALGARRKDVVISTKVGFRTGEALVHQGLSRRHILASAEASLRRLGTDYIDVFLAHRPDPHTPVEETIEALDQLVEQGKVRYVGFSNWSAWVAATAVGIQERRGWARFRAAELYYSLLGRDVEHELLPFLQHAGIGLLVWSPLAGGFLTGKYTREHPDGDGGRLTSVNLLPYDREQAHAVVDRLREIAAAHNSSPSQVALGWLLAKPAVSAVLIGANKMEQLQDNLAAADLQLAAEEVASLDELTAPTPVYPNWFAARAFDAPVREALASKRP
jgi:aryl-alcohol dehydrogenase-like predicted oxidoreductase